MKKRGLSFLLCLVLLCNLLFVPASAAETVYFTAINDNVLALSDATMPIWHKNLLYVPYTVFNVGSTDIYLGVSCSLSNTKNTVTIFTLEKILVFDLAANTSYSVQSGGELSAKAIARNGTIYVPVNFVCRYFGLSYSYTSVAHGYLVRIKSEDVVLSDVDFFDAATEWIDRRYRDYIQSITPTTPTTPDVTPTVPDVTDPGVDEPGGEFDVPTYLAMRCDRAEGLESMVNLLDAQRKKAVFFFTPSGLAEQDDLVRRILGTGYSIGILAEGGTPEESEGLLIRGNELLERVGYVRTTIAMVPTDQREAVETAGWVCWDETVNAIPEEGATTTSHNSAVMRAIKNRKISTYITLDGSENSALILSNLLQKLSSQQFEIGIPVETRL